MIQTKKSSCVKFLGGLAIIVTFEVIILWLTLKGVYNESLSNNYKELFLAEAGYIGTILAIFFTFYALPIQNIVGKYSQEFLKRVVRDKDISISFIFLTLGLFYNFYFALVGASKSIATASFFVTLFATFILAFLVSKTIIFLDFRLHIRGLAKEIIQFINYNISYSRSKTYKDFLKVPGVDKDTAERMSKFQVPDSLVEIIRKKLDPITNATMQAINNNQLEIFSEGIKAIETITLGYIESRLDYGTYNDKFLTFVDEQFIIMSDISTEQPSQHFLPDIVNSIRNISIKCLEAKPARHQFGDNNLIIGFTTLLRKICLSKELFKETSYAPSLVCSSLGDIGIKAIDNNYPNDAYHCCVDKLSSISQIMLPLNKTFPDHVSNMANHAILRILNHGILTLDKSSIGRSYLLTQTIEEINKIIDIYLDSPKDIYRTGVVLSPFFGAMADNGLAQIFSRALSYRFQNPQSIHLTLETLEEFLTKLDQSIMFKALPNENYYEVRQMIEHLYQIGIFLIQFQYNNKDNNLIDKANKILFEKLFLIFTNSIELSFGSRKNWQLIDELYSKTFALIGILIFESAEKERIDRIANAEDVIKTVIEFLKKTKFRTEYKREISRLLAYLKFAGSWLIKSNSQSPQIKEISSLIKKKDKDLTYSTESVPFPGSLGLGIYPEWSVQFDGWRSPRPYSIIYPKYWISLDAFLNDRKAKEKLEVMLMTHRAKKIKK